jgi:uncharacterized membrane protein
MPDRYVFGPRWVTPLAGFTLLGLLALSALSNSPRAARLQSPVVMGVVCVVTVLNLLSLTQLIKLIVFHAANVDALRLLGSSITIWVANVIDFALLYWLVDGGGPDERRSARGDAIDFIFPTPPGDPERRPRFMDYVYLAFSTATAFSATDTTPVTTRARVLLMIEATASLLTIAITAARAINILQ